MDQNIKRRKFIKNSINASLGFTIVPRNVLGGKNFISPNDKIRVAYIGCGTQGIREMNSLLKNEKVEIVSVCDPNKYSTDYLDWSADGIKNLIGESIGNLDWGKNINGIPGGRDVGKLMVDGYYSKRSGRKMKGCISYEDFRELLNKDKHFDAVKVMTPDHLHATISIAAMEKGKHVVIHKPIANRIHEARITIEKAKKTGIKTHLLAYSKIPGNKNLKKMMDEGYIGNLKEIHNWSNRPVWPQWTSNPIEKIEIPNGMNWDLWLGPIPKRPYHPNYTHMTFRGWYDFGAGTIGDMGHYSLWPLFMTLGVEKSPYCIEANGTTNRQIINQVSKVVENDVAFPYSSSIKFKFAEQKNLPKFDLFWYDGGMKPKIPDELKRKDFNLPDEGMMFVGDKGKILAGFRCENPELITESKIRNYTDVINEQKVNVQKKENIWIESFINNQESPGSFLKAKAITETILLGAVALRAKRRLFYDSKKMKITNHEESNKYLYRNYRKGWEL